MGRRRLALTIAVVTGVLVAVGAPTLWLLNRPERTVGADAAAALADATPTPTASSRRSASSAPAEPSVPAVPTQDGRLGTGRSAAAIVPVGIRVPALDVDTKVAPIGVEPSGELEIPEDVQVVGWYEFGPRPGDKAGSVVMSGHIDSAEQGKGSFFRLSQLEPGDQAFVRMSDGKTWRYKVVSREEWPKSEVPLDRIFSRGGAPRLTLVTCGGGFREDIRSYKDNIAVTAVPDGVA